MGHTSILLTKGSLNNMISLTTILSGAASFDMKIKVFVMDDAVWAFRKDRYKDLKVDSNIDGYAESLKAGVTSGVINTWYDFMGDLKEFGEEGDITITLCGLMADIDKLKKEDFIDLVDRVATIGTFIDDVFEADKIISM